MSEAQWLRGRGAEASPSGSGASDVAISKVNEQIRPPLPIFEKVDKLVEAIERRAYERFEMRGREVGHDLDDWLEAERELLGSPAAELSEMEGVFQLQVTLPGFDAKEIEVTATPLRNPIRVDEVTATLDNGILRIEAPEAPKLLPAPK